MTAARSRAALPHPFLKWAGGKRQLLPDLLRRVTAAEPYGRYHEPFVGGGALFFELARTDRLPRKKAFLSDTNVRLVEAYRGLMEDVDGVIALLHEHQAQHRAEYYYEVRAASPGTCVERAEAWRRARALPARCLCLAAAASASASAILMTGRQTSSGGPLTQRCRRWCRHAARRRAARAYRFPSQPYR